MTEKPILFSGPMVRAILDGRKTQTRRIVKQPNEMGAKGAPITVAHYATNVPEKGLAYYWKSGGSWNSTGPIKTYAVGDLLWVREAHAIVGKHDPGFVLYRANGYEAECERHGLRKPWRKEDTVKWRPSIHMPRWASRITLRVTAVKVERLQDISEADAKAEGIYYEAPTKEDYDWYETFCEENGGDPTAPMDGVWKCEGVKGWGPTPQLMYRLVWESINGEDSWDSNPFVVDYIFERVI